MPRLIDDIRASSRFTMPWFIRPDRQEEWAQYSSFVWKVLLTDLPVLLADNVAKYFYESEQEHWDFLTDFPNMAPPYQQFWIEHKMPSRIHSEECGDTDMSHIIRNGRVGMLMTALEPSEVRTSTGEPLPPNCKWVIWSDLWLDYGKLSPKPIEGPYGACFMMLDAEGQIIEKPWMQSYCRERDKCFLVDLMTWYKPGLLAVSFLHCKNVRVDDNTMPKPLAKKYHARTGLQPTRYKTLVIEPLKEILRKEGRSQEVGLQKAMHICRGHFKDYREGRGLFGKYKMLVWQPSIVRGSKGTKAPAREVEVKIK